MLGAALPCAKTYGSTCEGLCVLGEGRVCRRADKGFPCPPPIPCHLIDVGLSIGGHTA